MEAPQTKQSTNTTSRNLIKQAIMIGSSMVFGLILGLVCHAFGDIIIYKSANSNITLSHFILTLSELIVNLFLRLIKMIVAPLVLSTLIAGIGNVQDTKTIKTIGIKVIIWFIGASIVSLGIGMLAANIIQPGKNFTRNLPPISNTHITYHFDLIKFTLHIVPDSVVAAMANNDMLQLVVFAVFFGLALAALPEKQCHLVREVTDGIGKIMLRITDMVMSIVPIVVFASLLSIATRNGLQVIQSYGLFLIEFYTVIFVMFIILIGTGYVMMGKRIFKLLPFIAEPVMVGFATASSESAFPRLLEQLEKFGIPPKISGFVVPLGYSFNLCGTMMFISFAAIFIAQAYDIHIPIEKQIMMLLVMMVSSKGIAGVPRASMVMLAAVMPGFGIPEAGLLLIVGIDQFLDMARTATSVLGNGIIAAIANEWDVKANKNQTTST